MEFLRRRLHFLKDAIDAEADAKFVLEGFDVDIARPVRVGFQKNHRDELDDRRVARTIVILLVLGGIRFPGLSGVFEQFVRGVFGASVVLHHELPDFLGGGADKFDLPLQLVGEVIHGLHVHGVANRHGQDAIAKRDRQGLVAARIVGLHHIQNAALRVGLAEIHELHAVLCREGAGDVFLGDDAVIDESLDQAFFRQMLARGPNLRLGDKT